ncbi:aspartate kinase [Caldimonas tepidiphila]|uniref:amino acid kinase family protein n=1 Tax=Caldimonas tepidiphila TaxID=2315841 RepID=UPI000E5C35C3|nr:aspartate kinase [Caldimonas tepidiphila]
MWVVKIGGSLNRDALLPQWLELLGTLGRGRVVLVPGGGAFADEVRAAQRHWSFDDVAAHNMAVLGMAQTAMLLRGLAPALQPVLREADFRKVLRQGGTALWMPLQLLREQADELTSWEVTSDSLALWLARRLNAERLVLVKSCEMDAAASFGELAQAGALDGRFAALAADAAFPIELLHRGELERMRALLIGEHVCAM